MVVGIAGQFLLFTRFRPVPCAAWKVGCQLARACPSAVRAEVPNCWCGLLDRQSVPVVAELLEGSHDAGAQSVVAPVRIQEACSLLTAQDFHRRDVDPGRCEVPGCC